MGSLIERLPRRPCPWMVILAEVRVPLRPSVSAVPPHRSLLRETWCAQNVHEHIGCSHNRAVLHVGLQRCALKIGPAIPLQQWIGQVVTGVIAVSGLPGGPFPVLSARRFGRPVTVVRREGGGEPREVEARNPLLEDRVLLTATRWHTMRTLVWCESRELHAVARQVSV